MKKLLKSMTLLAFVALTLTPMFAEAFNSATHLYISDKLFPYCIDKADLYYGSTAPDLAIYAASEWETAVEDTHENYIRLRSSAWTLAQRAFSSGWLTHNEIWGADFYAHICTSANGCAPCYVITKADTLLAQYPNDLNLEFAHDVIEVAIDLLLKRNNDLLLGQKLLGANLLRSPDDLNLLEKVLVLVNGRTDSVTLTSAESTFRNLVNEYALALGLPKPLDEIALAQLGVQLAQEMGITVEKQRLLEILHYALQLCNDYKPAIDCAIRGIKKQIPSPFCLQ